MPSPEKFKKSLELFDMSEEVISQIYEGHEEIVDKAPKKAKADFFKRAVDIMTEQVDAQKLQELMEWNACCKGGAREKAAKSFAKENAQLSLQDKLKKIGEVPNMGEPVQNEDGTITVKAVSYWNGEKFGCACPNFNGQNYEGKVSKNYCFCCAGHFKYHYEIMLGVKLETLGIESSHLDSNGEKPCVIKFAIA